MNVRGIGNASRRNLIVTGNRMKGKRGMPDYYVLDVQADLRDSVAKELKDESPHAASNEFRTRSGETRIGHGRIYSIKQYEMMAAAGEFMTAMNTKGERYLVGTLKADLMFVAGKGENPTPDLIINTRKPMGKSEFYPYAELLDDQEASVRAMKKSNEAARNAIKYGRDDEDEDEYGTEGEMSYEEAADMWEIREALTAGEAADWKRAIAWKDAQRAKAKASAGPELG